MVSRSAGAMRWVRWCGVMVCIVGMWGCATTQQTLDADIAGSKTPAPVAQKPVPKGPAVDALQDAWREAKRAEMFRSEAWLFAQEDVRRAIEASGIGTDRDTDLRALYALYRSRQGTPVFFHNGALTQAGTKAHTIVLEAWTHGLPKPRNWPEGVSGHARAYNALKVKMDAVLNAPLSDDDLRRHAAQAKDPSATLPLLMDHLSAQALQDLKDLDALRDELKVVAAKLDGALVASMWAMARASRTPIFGRKLKPVEMPPEMYTAPDQAIDLVVPNSDDYNALREGYKIYWEYTQKDAFVELSDALKFRLIPGREHKEVPALRARLEAEGFLTPKRSERTTTPKGSPHVDLVAEHDPLRDPQRDETKLVGTPPPGELRSDEVSVQLRTYDAELEEAVKAFQYTRGLKITGKVDRFTLAALNVKPETLLKRLELGLLRWHHSRSRGKERHVRVNIPRYQVQMMQGGRVERRFVAVTGKSSTRTPRFNGAITHMVTHPWWFGTSDDPQRIPPGRRNPLGHIAIKMRPHHHLIYLHGTSKPKLLNRPYRAFSHGCIRMREPHELAAQLLDEDPGKATSQDLKKLLDRKTTRTIHLSKEVPVFLEYNTTYRHEESGHMHFARDIYNNDGYFMGPIRRRPFIAATWAE